MMKLQKKAKRVIVIIIIILALAILVYGAYAIIQTNNNQASNNEDPALSDQETNNRAIEVEVVTISNASSTDNLYIETVASVNAQTQVKVTSLSQGSIKSLPFDLGDKVKAGQTLAYLKSNLTQTTYLNAQTNYYNMLNNLEAVKRTAQENVNQAEIGVKQAQESIDNAEINLESAQENYASTVALQAKTLTNAKDSAIVSYNNYIITVKDALEDVNYIINAEDGPQLGNISHTLSAKNISALTEAKNSYTSTKRLYNDLKDINPSRNNIEYYLRKMIELLRETKNTTNDTIIVLDNTVTSNNFSQSTLLAQQQSFSTLYSSLVNTLQSAETSLNNLNTTVLSQEKELIALQNNIQATKNQLSNAKISYNTALVSLNTARESKQQQVLSAQTQVDSALGQLNLSQEQLSDLSIKAPISGQITAKLVEVGADINPGQAIAEISQSDVVKILTNLPSEDIYEISLGQEVIINDDIEAKITNIAPSADPITKKVSVEILVDNKNRKLIPGTFVDIKIKKNERNFIKDGIIKLPIEAISITQTETFVYLAQVENQENYGQAVKQAVVLGETEANLVEIKSGLKVGDKVITQGSKLIEDNSLIRIK